MGKRSKDKGADFERHVCREMSLWLSHNERDDLFWRSSMSGGRATLKARAGESAVSQAGDISPIDKLGMDFADQFTIEAKHYKDIYIGDIVWGPRKSDEGIGAFWRQALNDAFTAGKLPMLIAKQNYKPTLVALQIGVIQSLDTSNFNVVYTEMLPAAITRFDDFLENVNPEEMISYAPSSNG